MASLSTEHKPLEIARVVNEHIGIATISKPPVNSLSEEISDAVVDALDRLERANVRVVILRADPRTKIWSAGHNIKEIPLDGQDPVTWNTSFEKILHRVRNFPTPVIAMIHASVWGGACDLVATCDLAVGTPQATFAITPVKIGIAYNTGGLTHFLGVVPLHIVKEMLFTGNPISAEDALRFGLLNRLVEPDDLESTTMEIAQTIASRAPLAVRALKKELQFLTAGPNLTADEFEQIQYARRQAFRSDDLKEGVGSFFEKRSPTFKGA